jgi:DNA-binding NtrC family response regulator
VTRILLANDQRDVLEALRILLKGEGYQTEAVTSLAGIFSALEKKTTRCCFCSPMNRSETCTRVRVKRSWSYSASSIKKA